MQGRGVDDKNLGWLRVNENALRQAATYKASSYDFDTFLVCFKPGMGINFRPKYHVYIYERRRV